MNSLIKELIDKAKALPDGRAKIELMEEAIRMLDVEGDIETGYLLRDEYVELASFQGYPLKALIAFSWQLGHYDRNPAQFDSYSLLWSYQWIINSSSHFLDISLEQINELLEDMDKRYREHGCSRRTYYYFRFMLDIEMGKLTEAAHFLQQYQAADRDEYTNCEACETSTIVQYYAAIGDYEQALKTAKPILSGQLRCAEIPHTTFSYLLLPTLYTKSEQEAAKLHRRGYALIKHNPNFIGQIGRHIEYLAVTHPNKGIPIFEQHLAIAMNNEDPLARMEFYQYSALLLQELIKQGQSYRPRLPAGFVPDPDAIQVERLIDHLKQLTLSAANAFDLRNSNHYYTDHAISLWEQ